MIIRRTAEDFLVTERLESSFELGVEPMSSGGASGTPRYALYKIRKRSMTTPDAVGLISRELGVPPGKISYGGLKDRHALTIQHITVDYGTPPKRRPEREVRADVGSGTGVQAKLAGFVDTPMTASAIGANVFRIVVRDCTAEQAASFAALAESWKAAAPQGPSASPSAVPSDGNVQLLNYFGSQRFGSNRAHQGWIGAQLAKGDFEQAVRLAIAAPARKDSPPKRAITRGAVSKWGKWADLAREIAGIYGVQQQPEWGPVAVLARGGGYPEAYAALPRWLRELHIEAFAAHIWNRALAAWATQAGAGDPSKLSTRQDDFGPLVFLHDPAAMTAAAKRQLDLPSATSVYDADFAPLINHELARFELALADLRSDLRAGPDGPGFDRFPRQIVMNVEGLTVAPPIADEHSAAGRLAVEVVFALPSGSYATVVLRALGQE